MVRRKANEQKSNDSAISSLSRVVITQADRRLLLTTSEDKSALLREPPSLTPSPRSSHVHTTLSLLGLRALFRLPRIHPAILLTSHLRCANPPTSLYAFGLQHRGHNHIAVWFCPAPQGHGFLALPADCAGEGVLSRVPVVASSHRPLCRSLHFRLPALSRHLYAQIQLRYFPYHTVKRLHQHYQHAVRLVGNPLRVCLAGGAGTVAQHDIVGAAEAVRMRKTRGLSLKPPSNLTPNHSRNVPPPFADLHQNRWSGRQSSPASASSARSAAARRRRQRRQRQQRRNGWHSKYLWYKQIRRRTMTECCLSWRLRQRRISYPRSRSLSPFNE